MKNCFIILAVAFLVPVLMSYSVFSKHPNISITVDGKPSYNKKPTLGIMLMDYFNDSLIVKADGKTIKSGLFKTDESTALADEIVFNPSRLKSLKRMTIQAVVNSHITETISFPYKRGYRSILVYHESNKWLIQYTNRELLLE
jgi:hypothetical protein